MSGKVGFPAINLPHGADRAVLAAIDAIRQRLTALEAAVSTATKTSQASITALQTSVSSISSGSSSSTSSTTSYKAGVAITSGQAVYESSSGYVSVADPTILSQSYAIIGIAQSSVAAGAAVTVATQGQVANVPGSSFAPSYPVFCGPAGALTQTPVNGYPALQVGVALSATAVEVQPDQQLITVMLNGATVGWRRQINFVNGSGVSWTATDNVAANRIEVTINQSIVVLPPAPLQDEWDWEAEAEVDSLSTWQTMPADTTNNQTPGG